MAMNVALPLAPTVSKLLKSLIGDGYRLHSLYGKRLCKELNPIKVVRLVPSQGKLLYKPAYQPNFL